MNSQKDHPIMVCSQQNAELLPCQQHVTTAEGCAAMRPNPIFPILKTSLVGDSRSNHTVGAEAGLVDGLAIKRRAASVVML